MAGIAVRVLLFVLFFVPQLATARVYMCVDPASGKTVFTDQGCPKAAAREEVRIDPTNVDSGANTRRSSGPKTWSSERESRKSGREYSAQQREATGNSATASINGGGG